MRFKPGDEVYYRGIKAVILGHVPKTHPGEDNKFMVRFLDDGYTPSELAIKEKYLTPHKNMFSEKCDCGALHTSNPTYHFEWCSFNKEVVR